MGVGEHAAKIVGVLLFSDAWSSDKRAWKIMEMARMLVRGAGRARQAVVAIGQRHEKFKPYGPFRRP